MYSALALAKNDQNMLWGLKGKVTGKPRDNARSVEDGAALQVGCKSVAVAKLLTGVSGWILVA